MEIVEDAVIVGAGIAGLTTSLGLHRMGIRSLVLESSDRLRTTGFAFTTWNNAWKALDAIGIGESLRQQHQLAQGILVTSTFLEKPTAEVSFKGHEIRCLQRKLLLETLANQLPSGTIRFSSKVVSIEEESGFFKRLHLADGAIIKTKALIGCDGVNSVVAKWLGFEKPVFTGRSAIRGCAKFEGGHGFGPKFRQFVGKGVRSGFLPCDDDTVFWFMTWTPSTKEEELEEDPAKLKQFAMNKLQDTSDEMKSVMEKTSLDGIVSSPLRYRRPWEILWGNISKGNVCVAGDALHPMTPDLGQGGCCALEDGVILARCLAQALLKSSAGEEEEIDEHKRIEMGLKNFAQERRWRSFDLVSTAYMVGFIQQNNGKMMNFFRDKFLSKFLSDFSNMTQDVEMKEQAAPSNSLTSSSPSTLHHLKEIASLIETGAYAREVRRILRAVRLTMALRRKLKPSVLSAFINFALTPGSEAHTRLSSYLPKEDEHEMEVDTATSASQAPAKHSLPELEIYCYLLVLIFLIDQKKYNEAKACSSASIARLKNLNRRTVDVLAARLYYYYSLCYELTGDLAEIRGNLLALHRIATLRHDELGQETLLNLLLRNYLHYNLYDQAEKLRSKAPRFEAHSNQQFCRYLFYLGKIRTIQLEYTDAKECLLQAARKAPVAALGFRVQCNKWAIIVRLLLGEIPERTVFMQKGMEKALRPYFELTNAVRIGDLELFRSVAEKFSSTFSSDRTHNLIVRLRHNVIRTGLRNISISYSRISLVDVAKKLRLDSVADAESIVAKAIRDGAIDATLDHANGSMLSKETGDIYSTNEPQMAFNSRIAFCLNMHNEAVRALRFPPNSHKEKESAEKRRERQQQEQELAKHIAEEDDDEF
ncbi:hypothetical protein CCACVL1_16626 [Corchorus capsularis]|uniref:PCI domain-containing protein n=1 Tax=Corchorus capsularis TaxID=210143 RepID=A0A1R3HW70_COCAP|nr:hypothetical protein CCACVL1_16626 [Corchorus capsularis]